MRLAAATLLAATLTFAPAAGADTLLPSIQRIVERGELVIAVVDGARPPMINRGRGGKLSGFDVDLGTDIADALGVEARFFDAGPGSKDIIDRVASGEADIGLSYLSASISAAKRVFFSAPYMIEAYTVFINRRRGAEFAEECPRMSDLRRMAMVEDQVGVTNDGPFEPLLQRSQGDLPLKRFEDVDSLASSVEAGDLAISLQGELSAKFFLSRNPAAFIKLRFCNVPGNRHRVSVAVRPDGQDLLRWLDLYISQRGVIIDLDSLIYRADRSTH